MIIFTDENIPSHLATGFQLIQGPESMKTGILLQVKHLPDHFGCGSKDKDWIPEMGKLKSCVITRELHLNRRKHEISILKEHNLGIFFMKAQTKKSGLSVWQMVEMQARFWPEIPKLAIEENRPFGYEVFINGKLKKIF